MNQESNLRTCVRGHQYYKSSDCPICPLCQPEKKSVSKFLSRFSAPARRALENNGITTIKELAEHTEKEVLSFHGIGKASIPALRASLEEKELKFKTK